FQKFGEAAILDIVVKMLPELAEKIAGPISSIDKLTVVDTGKGEGAARVSNYVTELMATAPEMLKSVSGIELDRLIKGLTQGKALPAASSAQVPAAASAGAAHNSPSPLQTGSVKPPVVQESAASSEQD